MTDILKDAQDFLKRAESCESTNRTRWTEDVKFARLGVQWPEGIKAKRDLENRPTLTNNKLGVIIRQVVNDARQNRPAIKVMPQDSKADPETAEVMTGLIRNIEQSSNADLAYDKAIDDSASGGWGYWRINLGYANGVALENVSNLGPEAFEQDICIERVMNPLSVYGDPDSDCADSSDWMECIVLEKFSKKAFEKKYPKATKSSFDNTEWTSVPSAWKTDKQITVAEYWTREEITVQIVSVQMADTMDDETGQPVMGDVVTMLETDWQELQKDGAQGQMTTPPRPVQSYKVRQHVVTGVEVLEDREWPGIYIPIVPIYGDEVVVEGQRYFRSLISDARGAQEQHNFWMSAATEMVGLATRMPYIGRAGSFVDPNWKNVNKATLAYLEVPMGMEFPQRQPLPSLPSAELQLALSASDNVKATTGIFDASLGARSNETSGKAILARQREGDVSTFHFIDNQARGLRHTGKILIDLIPKVYSTPRIVRILGEDGKPQNRQVNQPYQATGPQGQPAVDEQGQAIMRMHDFKAGRYDLAVSTGPSFTTKREEAANQMIELIRAYPAAAPMIGDLLAKNLDWPGADEIAERLKKLMEMQMQPQQGQGQAPPQTDPAETAIKGGELQVKQYEAETERLKVQQQAAMTPQQIQQMVIQTVHELLAPQGMAA